MATPRSHRRRSPRTILAVAALLLAGGCAAEGSVTGASSPGAEGSRPASAPEEASDGETSTTTGGGPDSSEPGTDVPVPRPPTPRESEPTIPIPDLPDDVDLDEMAIELWMSMGLSRDEAECMADVAMTAEDATDIYEICDIDFLDLTG